MERAERSLGTHPRYQFGPFLIEVGERVLRRDGHPVALTPKTFDLLAALLERPGQLISKDELLEKVWPGTFVEESNLAYNVFALRKALGDTAENSQYIETVPKRGYRFTAAVTPADTETTILPFRHPPARSHTAVERTPDPYEVPVEATPRPGQAPPLRFSASRWLWLAVASALVAAVSFAALKQRAPTDAEPPRALPLTSLPGVVRSPSLSPDGSYVVFTWNGPKKDNPDLYVQQIGVSAPPFRLTSDPGNDYSASWSPDGRTIAFLRRGPAGRSEVWRIAPLGGVERKVTDIQPRLAFFRPASIGWCPDSTCLLVTDTTGPGKPDAIFVVPLETGGKRQLTYPEGLVMDADPAVSPDGRSLVFRRDTTPFSGEFFRLSLNGRMDSEGNAVRLTPMLYAGKAVWIPDSREILFSARGGLWRLDTSNGGTPTRLPFIGQDGMTPVVSRAANGRRRLVYVRSFADMNVWRVDTSRAGAPAASQPAVAIASTRSDGLPNLAPDGRRVVFLSDRSGEFEFWVSDPNGSKAFQLTSMSILPGYAKWSPDGTLIAFHGDPAGRPDVLVVPAGGGEPRVITAGTPGGAYPSFSRDGQWIYFAAGLHKGESRIWKMPVAGGTPVQVTNNAAAIAIESYDGDLYYVDSVDKPGSVWRLPVGGGVPAKVVEGIVLGNFDVVEGGLYYIDRVGREPGTFFSDKPNGETQLRYFDFYTSRSSTVAEHLGSVGFGLTATRDGRTVLFSRVDSSIDELVVVEDFR
jgi:Tol biopolymer transport system component/DNA-binding winged helix-turn-helix (wHTH) protein